MLVIMQCRYVLRIKDTRASGGGGNHVGWEGGGGRGGGAMELDWLVSFALSLSLPSLS